jgi:hypothetical protein
VDQLDRLDRGDGVLGHIRAAAGADPVGAEGGGHVVHHPGLDHGPGHVRPPDGAAAGQLPDPVELDRGAQLAQPLHHPARPGDPALGDPGPLGREGRLVGVEAVAEDVDRVAVVLGRQLAAEQDGQAGAPGRGLGLFDPAGVVVVGEGDPGQAAGRGQLDHLLGGQGAVEKVEWVCRSNPGMPRR